MLRKKGHINDRREEIVATVQYVDKYRALLCQEPLHVVGLNRTDLRFYLLYVEHTSENNYWGISKGINHGL